MKRRLFVWFSTFGGGVLIGMALFLWAQLSGIRYARRQFDDLNFIEEFLGKITFLWRSLDQKLVLALGDVPDSYLAHGELLAKGLSIAGLVVLLLPLFFRPRPKGPDQRRRRPA